MQETGKFSLKELGITLMIISVIGTPVAGLPINETSVNSTNTVLDVSTATTLQPLPHEGSTDEHLANSTVEVASPEPIHGNLEANTSKLPEEAAPTTLVSQIQQKPILNNSSPGPLLLQEHFVYQILYPVVGEPLDYQAPILYPTNGLSVAQPPLGNDTPVINDAGAASVPLGIQPANDRGFQDVGQLQSPTVKPLLLEGQGTPGVLDQNGVPIISN